MWRAMFVILCACDSGTPPHVETAPPPPAPPPPAAQPPPPPPPPIPVAHAVTWKTDAPTNRVPQASCIKASDRGVEYAAWEDSVIRFCIYYHWKAPDFDVGCWAVDPDKGTYTANLGMPTVTRIPEADDDGGTSIDLDPGGGKLSLKGHDLRWDGKPKLKIAGTDGVIIGDAKRAFVVDRDGVVYEVTPSATPAIVRTLRPPKCTGT
ncbi:MAG: hypothetical protein QM831_36735 [Kofleriaceae bacterium]